MHQQNACILIAKAVAFMLVTVSSAVAENNLHSFGEVTKKKLNENFQILDGKISKVGTEATVARRLNIEYRECDSSGSNSTYCSAQCSSGYKVIGGGCSSEGSASYSQVAANRPLDSHDGWYCAISIDKQDRGTAKAKGYAICGK